MQKHDNVKLYIATIVKPQTYFVTDDLLENDWCGLCDPNLKGLYKSEMPYQ